MAPLYFISLINHSNEYLALIDSGAQLNVLSRDLVDTLSDVEEIACPISRLRGIDNAAVMISLWITVKFVLSNGTIAVVPMAVVNNIKTVIILGLPFLQQIQAKVDILNEVVETVHGPIIMMKCVTKLGVNLAQSVDDMDLTKLTMKTNLSTKNVERLRLLLQKYRILYLNKRRGEVSGLAHEIRLTTNRPIMSKARTHTEEHEKAIQQEVERMLQDGVIVPSTSPYCSEVVMVKKKSGEWRMCIDYRLLNKYTVDDKYNLPRISDLLYSIKGSKYFVALDLRSGYWQIPMDRESRPYTAFRCQSGLYEFAVMPFGLKTAPATFQRNMDFLLGDLRFHNVLVYLDDILIHHKDELECLELLHNVFERLKRAGMTINLSKSIFFPKSFSYLGHIVSEGQLRPDPTKVNVLTFIKPPTTVSELRSILGMIGYFQNYIRNYACIAAPMTDLLKGQANARRKNKVTSIQWTPQCQVALDTLVQALKDITLNVPMDGDELIVETDASDHAIGGVLMARRDNKLLPIQFVSKKLSGPQVRWAIREKEAYAILHCLKKFDRFVRPVSFTVITDNQSLKWLFEARTGKLARWAIFMSEYQMKVFWRKGSENLIADCLSRHVEVPDEAEDRMIYTTHVQAGDELPTIKEILQLQQTTAKPYARGYIHRGPVVYYRGGMWVPETLRTRVIAACHSLPPLNHPGVKRTKRIILRVFNWPNLHTDVTEYVQSCLICQRARGDTRSYIRSFPHNPLDGTFAVLHIDYWQCTHLDTKYTILTMIDAFTRWVEAAIVLTKTAEEASDVIFRTWICRYGVPRRLVSDNEAAFTSQIMTRLTTTLGIQKITTIPYHPQGNAPIEAFHKGLKHHLSNHLKRLPMEDALPLALFSYRATIHSATLESPAFLLYGCDPRPPQECDWRFYHEVSLQERIQFLNQLRTDILNRMHQLRVIAMKELTDINVSVGDLVLVRMNPHERAQQALRSRSGEKLLSIWSLPARIISTTNNGVRIVVKFLLNGSTKMVHISDLRKISPPTDEVQKQQWIAEFQREASLTKYQYPTLSEEVFHPQKRKRVD